MHFSNLAENNPRHIDMPLKSMNYFVIIYIYI